MQTNRKKMLLNQVNTKKVHWLRMTNAFVLLCRSVIFCPRYPLKSCGLILFSQHSCTKYPKRETDSCWGCSFTHKMLFFNHQIMMLINKMFLINSSFRLVYKVHTFFKMKSFLRQILFIAQNQSRSWY